jgi:Secretion system C-terminal sorting domain
MFKVYNFVKNNNKIGLMLIVLLLFFNNRHNAQTIIIDPNGSGGFENDGPTAPDYFETFNSNGWSTSNAVNNRWFNANRNTPIQPVCYGDGSAYISNSSNTTLAASYTPSLTSVSHLYRDTILPAGEAEIVLSFNYKGLGDGLTGQDGLKVYVVPSTDPIPVAGIQLTTGQVGSNIYNNKSSCSAVQILLSPLLAGTSVRLVFTWVNDALGSTISPIMIDDVSLTTKVLVAPGCANILSPLNGSVGVCLSPVTFKWLAPTTLGIPNGYKFSYGITPTATDILPTTNLNNVFTYTVGALSPNTIYYWKITPTNSIGDAVGCPVWSFTTGSAFSNPAIANTPVFTNFEDCSIWTIVNGTQTNKWEIGAATNNGGANSIYISDNNGLTNDYSSNTGTDKSIVHFYKDIAFPSGQTCITLKFDLRSVGDSTNLLSTSDNLRIYIDTTTSGAYPGGFYAPISGTDPPASQGCRLIGEYYYKNNYTEITINLNPAYAGTTKRLIFTWRNNGSNFLSPPAAIDNISIITSTQPAPDCANIVGPQNGASDLCEAGQILSWSPNVSGCNKPTSYNVYFGTSPTPPLVGNQLTTTRATGLLVQGTTYYWRIEPLIGAVPSPACAVVSFTTSASGIVNDLPCNAVNVVLGATIDGYNGCTNSTSEPAAPASPGFWTAGTLNTVWYKVVCPASGSLKVRTIPGTLTLTQIAVYQGTCASLVPVSGTWYNTLGPSCGNAFIPVKYSELLLTGLVAGSTYFIVVDGQSNLIGDFSFLIVDGALNYPGSVGQDCITTISPCSSSTQVINPGFLNFGLTCDITNPNSYATPIPLEENNSVWYKITTSGAGLLSFDIVPNDYGNPNPFTGQANPNYLAPGNEANFSFALWQFGGVVTCASITGNTSIPIRANTSLFGVTGCTTSGSAPVAYGVSFDAAYETSVSVLAGETYYLLVTNNTTDKVGFTMNFGTSPINYLLLPPEVTWSGGNNFSWTNPANWGGCSAPSCPVDAIITPASVNQPILLPGTYRVKSLTIDAGSTLTLNSSAILEVCGNFVNNGNIVALPGSTVRFNGTGNQTIGGDISLLNKLHNIEITKASGNVFLNSNIEVAGNLTISNSTSILNTQGNSIKLAGNFYNYSGNTTFIDPIGTTIIEFYGATPVQNFQEVVSGDISNIEMNKTAGIVNLLSNLRVKSTGTLTLTNGIFTTNTFEVNVQNTSPTSLIGGNSASYINGNFRRSLTSLGSYNFPVGIISKGYQLANIDFVTATTIPNLLARFDLWPGVPPIQGGTECLSDFIVPAQDNGYWTINASANGTTGTYNATLYPTGSTNTGLALGWSIIKSATSTLGPWLFNGTCVLGGTSALVRRNSMDGFSLFAAGQANIPLPVELLSFTGRNYGEYNLLKWQTATEINNDYFEVEKSTDGYYFESIGTVDGQGNSTILTNYSFKDDFLKNTVEYYRLKQTDFNGTYTYSATVAIDNSKSNLPDFGIVPNPFKDEFEISLSKLEKGEYIIEIYNLMGQLVKKQLLVCESKNCSTIINASELRAGSYCVKVISEKNNYITSKIVIKN